MKRSILTSFILKYFNWKWLRVKREREVFLELSSLLQNCKWVKYDSSQLAVSFIQRENLEKFVDANDDILKECKFAPYGTLAEWLDSLYNNRTISHPNAPAELVSLLIKETGWNSISDYELTQVTLFIPILFDHNSKAFIISNMTDLLPTKSLFKPKIPPHEVHK